MELHSQQSRQTSETGSPLLSWPCPHGHNLQPPPHHYHYHRPHTIRHAHQTTTNGFMTITPIGSLPSSNRTAPKPALSFKTIRKWQTNSPPTLQRQDLPPPMGQRPDVIPTPIHTAPRRATHALRFHTEHRLRNQLSGHHNRPTLQRGKCPVGSRRNPVPRQGSHLRTHYRRRIPRQPGVTSHDTPLSQPPGIGQTLARSHGPTYAMDRRTRTTGPP